MCPERKIHRGLFHKHDRLKSEAEPFEWPEVIVFGPSVSLSKRVTVETTRHCEADLEGRCISRNFVLFLGSEVSLLSSTEYGTLSTMGKLSRYRLLTSRDGTGVFS